MNENISAQLKMTLYRSYKGQISIQLTFTKSPQVIHSKLEINWRL